MGHSLVIAVTTCVYGTWRQLLQWLHQHINCSTMLRIVIAMYQNNWVSYKSFTCATVCSYSAASCSACHRNWDLWVLVRGFNPYEKCYIVNQPTICYICYYWRKWKMFKKNHQPGYHGRLVYLPSLRLPHFRKDLETKEHSACNKSQKGCSHLPWSQFGIAVQGCSRYHQSPRALVLGSHSACFPVILREHKAHRWWLCWRMLDMWLYVRFGRSWLAKHPTWARREYSTSA